LKDGGGIGSHCASAVPPPIASAQAYIEVVAGAFRRAVDGARPPVERDYAVAGHHLRLRFANDALVGRVTPALARFLRLRPCYRSVLGADVADIPVVIRAYLATGA